MNKKWSLKIMESLRHEDKEFVTLLVIHMALALALPVLLLVGLGGCGDQLKETQGTMGPEVKPAAIEAALTEALEKSTPDDLSLCQFSHYELNQRVESGAIVKLTDQLTHVISREVQSNQLILDFRETTIEYSEDNANRVTKEYREIYPTNQKDSLEFKGFSKNKNNENGSLRLLSKVTSDLENFVLKPLEATPIRTTFHDLRVERRKKDPPQAVRKSPNCRGLKPCQLETQYIEFEKVDWFSDTDWEKIRFRYEISTQAPYLGVFLNACMTLLIDVQGRSYLVTQCQVLRDFAFSGTLQNGLCPTEQ